MRVFITRDFARFARREKIDHMAQCEAIARAERGLIDADLGSNLIKQRVPRAGQGRSGGFRTIVAYCRGDRAVFLHGFAKSARDNVDTEQLKALKRAAAAFLGIDAAMIETLLNDGKWFEVNCDG